MKLKFFFYGIIAALGAMLVELVLKNILSSEISLDNIFFTIITPSLILFALTEEAFKFAVINKAVSSLKNPGDIFSGALLIGLGFSLTDSLTEIYLGFSVNFFEQTSYLLAILGILIVHLSTSLLFGYFSFKKSLFAKTIPAAVFIFATLLHLLYNIFIIYNLPLIIVLIYLSALLGLSFLAFCGLIKKAERA